MCECVRGINGDINTWDALNQLWCVGEMWIDFCVCLFVIKLFSVCFNSVWLFMCDLWYTVICKEYRIISCLLLLNIETNPIIRQLDSIFVFVALSQNFFTFPPAVSNSSFNEQQKSIKTTNRHNLYGCILSHSRLHTLIAYKICTCREKCIANIYNWCTLKGYNTFLSPEWLFVFDSSIV